MMHFGICVATDSKIWDDLYQRLDVLHKSPFFTSSYYQSYSSIEKDESLCYYGFRDGDNLLFYPFIKQNINSLGYDLKDEYYDISGAYGYNGPIGKVNDPTFAQQFNQELQTYLRDSNVVTEFVRYCPIIGNRDYHHYTKQIDVLDNVFIELDKGLDFSWNEGFNRRIRTAVRKGEAYGLKTYLYKGSQITGKHVKIFFDIYNSTMQRNEAESFYYFDLDFFNNLVINLRNMLLVLFTYFQDKPISTELILTDGELAYGFLGGTLSDFYQYKANTFQRWELLKYLDSIGVKKYSMGGGASRGDSIYDYKMSFAKGCVNPFYIGTMVHYNDVYQEIVKQWKAKHPIAAQKYGHMLQGYRKLDL